MSSTWGISWGTSWGLSWNGAEAPAPQPQPAQEEETAFGWNQPLFKVIIRPPEERKRKKRKRRELIGLAAGPGLLAIHGQEATLKLASSLRASPGCLSMAGGAIEPLAGFICKRLQKLARQEDALLLALELNDDPLTGMPVMPRSNPHA